MMEHVLMDERGNTTKSSYSYESKRSTLAYLLFALMFIIGGAGVAFLYNFSQGPTQAATFTPILSSPLAGFGGHCTVTPDAEDFAACSTDWEPVADSQVLRCPSGYGNIKVLKVKDGETGGKNYRDMALIRHYCKGMDNCKLSLGELRAADDGMPLEDKIEIPVEEEIIIEPIEPEEIIEDVAGVDSNGHVLMKHHGHHHHMHRGQVKIKYECEKNEESPFEALESFFEDLMMMGPGEIIEEPAEEEIGTEELPPEETPIFLSKKHGGCHKGLKNIAQDWDAGVVCGTLTDEMTLSCDPERTGARIFVMSVHTKNKHQKQPADSGTNPIIEDTEQTVEAEPFLAKHGRHKHQGGKHKEGKQLGWQLTDVCNAQEGDCTVVLGEALQTSFSQNPLITESTPMHVKYMCSYEHQEN